MKNFKKNTGQIILVLLLIMTIALGIGLAIIQRSLTDVSTATKVEQSQRAFSAAEAGIERAVRENSDIIQAIPLGNDSQVEQVTKLAVPSAKQALEYPPMGKEDIGHVWLASLDTLANYYTQTSLDIYWGTANVSDREQPAIEITAVYQNTDLSFLNKKFYIDPVPGAAGQSSNGFKDPSFYGGNCSNPTLVTSFSKDSTDARPFRCKVTLGGLPNSSSGLPKLILLRARLLYNSTYQPFAVAPTGGCDTGCSLPLQARIFTSTGSAGDTRRKVQLFQLDKVVPYYFDYAIFSAGEIRK